MDFNVKRLAADAGTFLSRAVQVSSAVETAAAHANQLACSFSAVGKRLTLIHANAVNRYISCFKNWCLDLFISQWRYSFLHINVGFRNPLAVAMLAVVCKLAWTLYSFCQFTEEKLGQAEKTELDAHLENLLVRAENTKAWTEKIMKQTEVVLQPNPSKRHLLHHSPAH